MSSFTYNLIKYSIINEQDKTVRVGTKADSDENTALGTPNAVSIDFHLPVSIPSYVIYKNKKYAVIEIGSEAFRQCSKIESVKLPSSIRCIRFAGFDGCYSIASFTFPHGSQLETLEKYALSRMYKIKELSLPFTIKTVGHHSLACLHMLTDLYYCSSYNIEGDAFGDNFDDDFSTPTTLRIHVTNQYQNTTFGFRTKLVNFDNIVKICQCIHVICTHSQYKALSPSLLFCALALK